MKSVIFFAILLFSSMAFAEKLDFTGAEIVVPPQVEKGIREAA